MKTLSDDQESQAELYSSDHCPTQGPAFSTPRGMPRPLFLLSEAEALVHCRETISCWKGATLSEEEQGSYSLDQATTYSSHLDPYFSLAQLEA